MDEKENISKPQTKTLISPVENDTANLISDYYESKIRYNESQIKINTILEKKLNDENKRDKLIIKELKQNLDKKSLPWHKKISLNLINTVVGILSLFLSYYIFAATPQTTKIVREREPTRTTMTTRDSRRPEDVFSFRGSDETRRTDPPDFDTLIIQIDSLLQTTTDVSARNKIIRTISYFKNVRELDDVQKDKLDNLIGLYSKNVFGMRIPLGVRVTLSKRESKN